MNAQIRHKFSTYFTLYNQSRAEARRCGDTKKIEALNKMLIQHIKDAYRSTHSSELTGRTKVLFITKNLCAMNQYYSFIYFLGAQKFTYSVIDVRPCVYCPATFLRD